MNHHSTWMRCAYLMHESRETSEWRESDARPERHVTLVKREWHTKSCNDRQIKCSENVSKLFTNNALARALGDNRNKCTPRVHSRLSTKNCQWDVKDTWSRLCLVGLQNVNPQNGFLKRSKCNPGCQSATGGVQKISHILVPIIRLKLTRDEDAAFAYYFVPGFTTKLPIFDPGVKILKFYQGYLGGSTSTSVFRKLICC